MAGFQSLSKPVWISLIGDSLTRHPFEELARLVWDYGKPPGLQLIKNRGDDVVLCCRDMTNLTSCGYRNSDRGQRSDGRSVAEFVFRNLNNVKGFCVSWGTCR